MLRGAVAVLCAAMFWAEPANATFVVDFEDLSAGTVIGDQYAAQIPGGTSSGGVTITTQNFVRNHDVGVVFDTDNPTGGDDDLGAPFSAPLNPGLDQSFEPGKVLIVQERLWSCQTDGQGDYTHCNNPDDEGVRPSHKSTGKFTFEFTSAIFLETIDFFDVEAVENGTSPHNEIFLFGPENTLIATHHTPNTGGDNQWNQLAFNTSGVVRIEIELHGSGAIDNIRGAFLETPASEAAEPGTLSVFAFGLWAAHRLRRRRAAHGTAAMPVAA